MGEISSESPRMRSGGTSSPEFEFWMVDKISSAPQPGLLTADELFVDGVLLPLDLLSLSQNTEKPSLESEPELENAPPPPPPLPPYTDSSPGAPPNLKTMKWRDLFKVGEKTLDEIRDRRNQKRRDSVGGGAELNIHIWPFSRSRSAGNAGVWNSRLRTSRKVSSAPCSRSNSRGESSKPAAATAASSSSRRWTSNPVRPVGFAGGIRLGRTGPVLKLRRKINLPESKEKANNIVAGGGGERKGGASPGVRVLNFNVNTCIGYGNQVSCKVSSGDNGDAGDVVGGGRRSNGSLFYLKTIFSKKVYGM